jgi:hypothetical protein
MKTLIYCIIILTTRLITTFTILLHYIYTLKKGEPDWKRVLREQEVDDVLHQFHYSPEKGGHSGRDAMVYKISM